MPILPRRRKADPAVEHERLGLEQLAAQLNFLGHVYPVPQTYTTWAKGEAAPSSFPSYVANAYKANGVVFACVLARLLVFSEARFAYRRYVGGRPGNLFGDTSLDVLERPWPNGTTGELLARMEQDASLAGNSYWTRRGDRLVRLRPDRVTIIIGTDDPDALEVDATVLGYAYTPDATSAPVLFDVSEVAHYSPIPDPDASFRGMSWLTPVLEEIDADRAAMRHKGMFFRNGATPNMVVTSDNTMTADQATALKDSLEARFRGVGQAYRTMVLSGGLDVRVVGADLRQLDFKTTQGHGETRIAAAAGVPPVIVGLSEGLEASTYSNYAQARRRFADATMRPLWRIAAASLERLVPPPEGGHLWYDDRDVAFLREDVADQATINQTQAATIRQLIDAGYDPDAAVDAVLAGDFNRLRGQHTGLYSIQLQKPGDGIAGGAVA